jgi:hypothetical protein
MISARAESDKSFIANMLEVKFMLKIINVLSRLKSLMKSGP